MIVLGINRGKTSQRFPMHCVLKKNCKAIYMYNTYADKDVLRYTTGINVTAENAILSGLQVGINTYMLALAAAVIVPLRAC